jgi:hypothetical protein
VNSSIECTNFAFAVLGKKKVKYRRYSWPLIGSTKHLLPLASEILSKPEIAIMIVFGMIVPTGDNYSDIWVSWNFFSGKLGY